MGLSPWVKKPLFLSYMEEEGEEDSHTTRLKHKKGSEHVPAFLDAERARWDFFCTQTAVQGLIWSLWNCLKLKVGIHAFRHIQQKTFTMFTFLFFIYSVKLPILQVSHGWNTELSRFFFFSTKLWYKLAQFSILLLINLTGAQFVN